MDWAAIGAISQTLAAIAVVATLFFLGTQLAQTNRIATTAVARELQARYSDFYTLIATNPEIRGLVTRLREPTYTSQSDDEDEQIEAFCLLLLGIWLNTAIAYERSQIDLSQYRIYCDDVTVKMAKWPGLRPHAVKILGYSPPNGKPFEIFRPFYE